MSRNQRWREEFLVAASKAGLPLDVSRKVLRHAATLQRLAELACSSEAADRDRVPCPLTNIKADSCPCKDYGSGEIEGTNGHRDVPRINIQADRTEARVTALVAPYGLKAYFAGDPRGAVVSLVRADVAREDFESGRERGISVPA